VGLELPVGSPQGLQLKLKDLPVGKTGIGDWEQGENAGRIRDIHETVNEVDDENTPVKFIHRNITTSAVDPGGGLKIFIFIVSHSLILGCICMH